jgi:hypothetical protein
MDEPNWRELMSQWSKELLACGLYPDPKPLKMKITAGLMNLGYGIQKN